MLDVNRQMCMGGWVNDRQILRFYRHPITIGRCSYLSNSWSNAIFRHHDTMRNRS